jgi:hypothetical protein
VTSLVPFVNRLQIVTKELRVVQLGDVLNHAQYRIIEEVDDALNAHRPCRFIVLKARQIGVSTVIEGLMFTLAIILRRMGGLVVSHEADSAAWLLKMTNHYWETWRFKELYSIRHNSVRHMSWDDNGSSIRIATAKNVGAGRSTTVQFLHGSEVAFWDDATTLMTGLANSIPDTHPSIIAMESTANGIGGYFHEQWNMAVDRETDFTPLFFPWHQHPQYTATDLQMAGEDDVAKILGHLDDEERVLRAIGIGDERLIWRRWQIKNKLNGDVLKFKQEYPTVPEEAFIVTGHNIFPDAELTACYQPMHGLNGYLVAESGRVRFQESIDGPLTIFRFPGEDMEKCKYMISGDATRSITGDYSCAQVLNRRTWEQVAIFRRKIDPMSFGDQMSLLGRYYNWAILCPEIQGAGDATISRLISLNYPFLFEHRKAEKIMGQPETVFGWWSGVRAKQEAMGNLLKAVVDGATPSGGIIIHDHKTYEEMRAYVSDEKGGFKNGTTEKHDDTVTALAIAMTCVMYEAPNINASLGVYDHGKMQEQAGSVNRALEVSGMRLMGDGLDEQRRRDEAVTQDEVVLPWELGDQEQRMANVMEQAGGE